MQNRRHWNLVPAPQGIPEPGQDSLTLAFLLSTSDRLALGPNPTFLLSLFPALLLLFFPLGCFTLSACLPPSPCRLRTPLPLCRLDLGLALLGETVNGGGIYSPTAEHAWPLGASQLALAE